jgi:hypothetical protein
MSVAGLFTFCFLEVSKAFETSKKQKVKRPATDITAEPACLPSDVFRPSSKETPWIPT